MNIALPALVVFVLLLPGFIARSRIKRAERLSLDYSPFGHVVTEAVIWSIGLHLIWAVVVRLLTPWQVRPDIALELLSTDARIQASALETVSREASWIGAYFGTLLAFAYLGSQGTRWFITRCRLDRAGATLSGLLRFSGAPWYLPAQRG